MFTTIFTNVISIFSISIFTRNLSPEDYGFYALSLLYGSVIVGICNFGLSTGYERDFFENKNRFDSGGLLYTTVLFVTTITITVALFLFSFKETLSNLIFGSSQNGYLLFFSFIYLGLSSIKNYFLIYFKNSENARLYFIYTVIDSLFSLIISFLLIFFFKMGVLGLAVGQFLGTFSIILFVIYSIACREKFKLNTLGFLKTFKDSFPLSVKILVGIIGGNLDKVILGKLDVISGLGIYNFGQKVGYLSFTFINSIHPLFNPTVYRIMFEKGKNGGVLIGKYLTKYLYISIFGALIISFFSEELIIIISPSSYYKSIDIATIFAMLYATTFFGMIPQLIYANKTKLISLISILSILFNFIIISFFIFKWGTIGAAFGSLFSGLIICFVSFFIYQKYYYINWEFKKINLILLLFFGSSIILILLRHYSIHSPARFVFKLIIIYIYYLIGSKCDILPPELNFTNIKFQIETFIKNKK